MCTGLTQTLICWFGLLNQSAELSCSINSWMMQWLYNLQKCGGSKSSIAVGFKFCQNLLNSLKPFISKRVFVWTCRQKDEKQDILVHFSLTDRVPVLSAHCLIKAINENHIRTTCVFFAAVWIFYSLKWGEKNNLALTNFINLRS